jgi:hypothetical protein
MVREVDEGVTITLKDVYLEVGKVKDAVAPIGLYGQQLGDHETRMRALERWRYSAHASLGVSAGSLATAITAIITTLNHH